ncbi:unnamed protein product [Pleuronectes platessa]|uniref:Uncharacterized protein n=1 Tax=Pleuronectes platessa TaxID=8262 RepID=A0A9N7YGB2_PLEPL|nr:unnamed protein product [Pleuronectes platessa]
MGCLSLPCDGWLFVGVFSDLDRLAHAPLPDPEDSTHLTLREGRGEATKANHIVSFNGGRGLMEFCPSSGWSARDGNTTVFKKGQSPPFPTLALCRRLIGVVAHQLEGKAECTDQQGWISPRHFPQELLPRHHVGPHSSSLRSDTLKELEQRETESRGRQRKESGH